MRILFLILISIVCFKNTYSQINTIENPTINLRATILLFPTTPLLTLEVRTTGNLTLQLESNFINTHGINLKYFLNKRMNKSYVFTGIAFVENDLLREDGHLTLLPYAGYGYALRFGNKKQWTFDSRIGFGPTLNADTNGVYPVLKTGIGRIF